MGWQQYGVDRSSCVAVAMGELSVPRPIVLCVGGARPHKLRSCCVAVLCPCVDGAGKSCPSLPHAPLPGCPFRALTIAPFIAPAPFPVHERLFHAKRVL